MKFIITGLISYEVDEEFFNNLLKEVNITLEDYKKEVTKNFKKMLEKEISVLDEKIKNLTIQTNMQIEEEKEMYQYECDLCGKEYINTPNICRCGGTDCFIKFK